MSSFASKSAPTSEKLRGGYYTPPRIAEFLAEWVSGAGERLLEPSCGDGAILRELTMRGGDVTGIELDAREADIARLNCPDASVLMEDFFAWFNPTEYDAWDGVAGNPPFIRFQHWTEPTRGSAFDVTRQIGMRPNKLTNAWVPFVVASALATRPEGRLGLVVPAEIMQVTYAAELRAFLVDEFKELTVVTFQRLVFDGILQEVVLLLGIRGQGPARIKVAELEDANALPGPDEVLDVPHAPALRHEVEKWTKYFLDTDGIHALRTVRESAGLCRLGDLADVDVGIVTGRNQFFVMRPSVARDRQLVPHTLPIVSKSAQLQGVRFSGGDFDNLVANDALCHLLAVEPTTSLNAEKALSNYVEEGEAADVHVGYKCSIRRKWWVVPSIWVPDAFLLRQIYDHPRIIANLAGATSTDTIHRVRMLNGTQASALAAASINSATFAFSEVMGRSYGGGVLELEPRESENLPVPDPQGLEASEIAHVDGLVRDGKLIEALDYVDRKLLISTFGTYAVASSRGGAGRLIFAVVRLRPARA